MRLYSYGYEKKITNFIDGSCNGVYVLFEVGAYGGNERYEGTYFKEELERVVLTANGWT